MLILFSLFFDMRAMMICGGDMFATAIRFSPPIYAPPPAICWWKSERYDIMCVAMPLHFQARAFVCAFCGASLHDMMLAVSRLAAPPSAATRGARHCWKIKRWRYAILFLPFHAFCHFSTLPPRRHAAQPFSKMFRARYYFRYARYFARRRFIYFIMMMARTPIYYICRAPLLLIFLPLLLLCCYVAEERYYCWFFADIDIFMMMLAAFDAIRLSCRHMRARYVTLLVFFYAFLSRRYFHAILYIRRYISLRFTLLRFRDARDKRWRYCRFIPYIFSYIRAVFA